MTEYDIFITFQTCDDYVKLLKGNLMNRYMTYCSSENCDDYVKFSSLCIKENYTLKKDVLKVFLATYET